MILSIVLCVILIMMDRVAKLVAVQVLLPVGVLPAIPGFFEWRYVENNGAAFSFFAGKQLFLIIVTSIALLVVAYLILFRRPKDRLEYIALILIFSGGVGNLIDRISQGYVVDYISLQFMNFAVFNLADIFVCVGFAILVFAVIRSELRAKKQKDAASGQAAGEAAPLDAAGETPPEAEPAPGGQAASAEHEEGGEAHSDGSH